MLPGAGRLLAPPGSYLGLPRRRQCPQGECTASDAALRRPAARLDQSTPHRAGARRSDWRCFQRNTGAVGVALLASPLPQGPSVGRSGARRGGQGHVASGGGRGADACVGGPSRSAFGHGGAGPDRRGRDGGCGCSARAGARGRGRGCGGSLGRWGAPRCRHGSSSSGGQRLDILSATAPYPTRAADAHPAARWLQA